MRAGYVIEHDLNYEAVVFESGPGGGLSIQRALEFDEQDVALGMATYCIALASGPTVYGGVARWRVSGETVTFVLAADAARELGIDPEIALDVDLEDLNTIQPHLSGLLIA